MLSIWLLVARMRPPSSTMRSQLLFAGPPSPGEYDNQAQVIGAGGPSSFSYGSRRMAAGFTIESPLGTAYVKPGSDSTEAILASRVVELEGQVEDGEYESSKKFKEQSRLIASQRNEIDLLRSITDQFQQNDHGFAHSGCGTHDPRDRCSVACQRSDGRGWNRETES